MGIRAFLTDTYASGMFAKLDRDHRIVEIFDGSTSVNRSALALLFGRLARRYHDRYDEAGLAAVIDLQAPLTDFEPARR